MPASEMSARPLGRPLCRLFVAIVALVAASLWLVPVEATHAATPKQESTRKAKIAFMKRLPEAPNLVFLGGSRAHRLSPEAYQRITGKTAFNAAVMSCSLADAYAFVRLVGDTFPDSTVQYVWMLNIEQFRRSRVPNRLYAQPELAQYMPASLPSPYEGMTLKTAGTPPKTPPKPWGMVDVFTDRGRLRWNRYDYWRARWRTLSKGLRYSRWVFLRTYPNGYRRVWGVPKWFLKETIKEVNRKGVTPVIVLPPYHPSLHRLIKPRGFDRRMREVKAYFRQLEERGFDFVLLDMTQISSFRGWSSGFYDGVHMRTSMTSALLRKVISLTGDQLR